MFVFIIGAVRMATQNKEHISKIEEEIGETLKMAPNQPGGKNYERKVCTLTFTTHLTLNNLSSTIFPHNVESTSHP